MRAPPLPCCLFAVLIASISALSAPPALGAELQQKTVTAWDTYVAETERRIDTELADPVRFLVVDFGPQGNARAAREALRRGSIEIRKMESRRGDGGKIEVEDAMIHHWIGAIFIPGVRLDALVRWVQDYDHHDKYFQEVEKSRLISRQGDTFQIYYKLRRKKVITVYYNSYYTATYRQKDSRHVFSRSKSTKIAQLDDADTPNEREVPAGKDSGFLWRLNSYWRFLEEDGGVYVECESVSLSRAIPFGLGWMISGYVESVPRESLASTLTSLRDGVKSH